VSIFVTWIGEGTEPHGLIGDAIRVLGREYARPAARVSLDARPPDTYDIARRQHSSRGMLTWLAARVSEIGGDGMRLLGVTDVDLFIPVLTFVFGEAQLGRYAAVVSIARLREAAVPALVSGRLTKEAVHEIGHTFGLVHCASASCVMARSPGLAAVDRKTDRLCADCRVRYQALREQPYVAAHTPHSDR
jgi:archaemetzincin